MHTPTHLLCFPPPPKLFRWMKPWYRICTMDYVALPRHLWPYNLYNGNQNFWLYWVQGLVVFCRLVELDKMVLLGKDSEVLIYVVYPTQYSTCAAIVSHAPPLNWTKRGVWWPCVQQVILVEYSMCKKCMLMSQKIAWPAIYRPVLQIYSVLLRPHKLNILFLVL